MRRIAGQGYTGGGCSSAANAEFEQKTLETAGTEIIPENGGGPGLRLRK